MNKMEHNYNLSINKSCQEINTYLDEKFKLHLSTFQKESEKIKDDITNNLRTELIKNMTGEQHFTPNYKKDYFENFLKLIDNKNINYEKIKEVLDDDEYIIGFNGIIGIELLISVYKKKGPQYNNTCHVTNMYNHTYTCSNNCKIGKNNNYSHCDCTKQGIKKEFICESSKTNKYNPNCYKCKTWKLKDDYQFNISRDYFELLSDNLSLEYYYITNKLNKIIVKYEQEKNKLNSFNIFFSIYQPHNKILYQNIYKEINNYTLNDIQIDLISNTINTIIVLNNKSGVLSQNGSIQNILYLTMYKSLTIMLDVKYNDNIHNIMKYYEEKKYRQKWKYSNGKQLINITDDDANTFPILTGWDLKSIDKELLIPQNIIMLHYYYYHMIDNTKIIYNSLKNYILCNWKGKYLTIPEAIQIKNENKRLLELNEKTTDDLVKNSLILEELQKYSSLDEKIIKCNNLNEKYNNKMILLEEREKNILRKEKELVKKELQIQESIGEKESELVIKLVLIDDHQDILNKSISKYETKNNKLKESKAKLGFLIKSYKKNKRELENDKINFEKYKKNFIDDTNIILSDSEDTDY